MFHRGAEIPGDFPHLEGTNNKLARYMSFVTLDEGEAKGADLAALVRAWCDAKA